MAEKLVRKRTCRRIYCCGETLTSDGMHEGPKDARRIGNTARKYIQKPFPFIFLAGTVIAITVTPRQSDDGENMSKKYETKKE